MPEKTLTIRGVEWRYLTGGEGEQTILMFHDAVGGAETMRRLAEGFADEYRTITPTVADVTGLEEVCDAASAILDREHVGRAHVFGGSFGGMVAQAFLRRRWRQVESLTLLGTNAPNRQAGERAQRMWKLLWLLPFRLTRGLMRLEMSRGMNAPVPPDEAARVVEFKERLDNYLNRGLTKATLLSRVRLSAEFNLHESYSPADHAEWPGRVLIIESGDDPATPVEERRRLREAYPRALVCALAGSGQMIPLLRPEELVEVVKAFLKEDYKAPSDLDACPEDEEHGHAALR